MCACVCGGIASSVILQEPSAQGVSLAPEVADESRPVG